MADNLFEAFSAALDKQEYIAELSFILHLDEVEVSGDLPVLRVPECIDELFTSQVEDSEALLRALVVLWREDLSEADAERVSGLVEAIRRNYLLLRERQLVRPIADEADEEIRELMFRLIPEPEEQSYDGRMTLQGNFLRRVAGRVRKSMTTALTVSKKTGTAILTRGRRTLDVLSERIPILELPSKSDALLEKKANFSARLLPYKGVRSAKFYVGLALGIAGFSTTMWPVGVGGLMLIAMDP